MPFEPTKICATIAEEAMPGRGYGEYLTQGDWKLLSSGIDINKEIPLALRVLGRSHELHDSSHFEEALIQAVASLELAIDCRTRKAVDIEFRAFLGPFSQLRLRDKLLVCLGLATNVTNDEIRLALRAVDIRNDIVHKGKQVKTPLWEELIGVRRCVAALLDLPECKAAVLVDRNQLTPPEYGGKVAFTHGRISIGEA